MRARLPLYNAKDLSVLSYSLGTLGYLPEEPWVADFLTRWQRHLSAAGPKELGSLARLLALWRVTPDADFVHAFFRASQMRVRGV